MELTKYFSTMKETNLADNNLLPNFAQALEKADIDQSSLDYMKTKIVEDLGKGEFIYLTKRFVYTFLYYIRRFIDYIYEQVLHQFPEDDDKELKLSHDVEVLAPAHFDQASDDMLQFSTTWSVESLFSKEQYILGDHRLCLKEPGLAIMLKNSCFIPNFVELVCTKKSHHPTHNAPDQDAVFLLVSRISSNNAAIDNIETRNSTHRNCD